MQDIFNKNNRDILIAVALLLIGMLLTAFSLSKIINQEASDAAIARSIKVGTSHYFIRNQSRCVGEFSAKLEKQKGYALTLEGNFNARYQTVPVLATVKASSNFNALGQLTAFDISLNANEISMNLIGRGANPINIKVDSTLPDSATSKHFSLPGPIQIVPDSVFAKSYFISYPKLQITKLFSQISLSPEASRNIPLRFESDRGDGSCANREEFEMENLLTSYQYFLQMANQIPNQILGGPIDQH